MHYVVINFLTIGGINMDLEEMVKLIKNVAKAVVAVIEIFE